MPERIQLKRTKGWRMPANTMKVDRTTKWGNPFQVSRDGTRLQCVEQYRVLLSGYGSLGNRVSFAEQQSYAQFILGNIRKLHGKNLACWCALDRPCHADVLLELANTETEHAKTRI